MLLTSEEPTRFGIGCLGSRLISGTLDPARADAFATAAPTKDEERTLAAVRDRCRIHRAAERRVRFRRAIITRWVELHIEQGPLLEREGLPTGDRHQHRRAGGYRFTISGSGGHAGALLMPDRRDALCAAAELILSIEKHALATGAIDTVATVGTCDVHPGAVNSVPSRVVLQVDIRDTDPDRREGVMQAVRRDCEEIRQRRGVTIDRRTGQCRRAAQSSPHIVETMEAVCDENGIQYKKMVSRAYHDSLFMARIAPIAMIFIPCRGGVSHRPDEFATPQDIARGTRVLAEVLAKLASE